MTKRKNNTRQYIDEISRIRQRLSDFNDVHHRNIRDQLELAMCKMMEFLNEKPTYLDDYVKNLRNMSTDDIGQALLDNVAEQLKQIKTEINSTIELPDDDEITELDDANQITSKNYILLNLINRLHHIEIILHTHVGESHDDEN